MELYPHPDLVRVAHTERTERLRATLRRPRRSAPDVGVFLAQRAPHPTPAISPTTRTDDMDIHSATARFEAALSQQLALAGGDPAVEAAAASLRGALAPATRQLAFDLAEQAAAEVGAQLPGHDVEVVLRDGEPALAVRGAADPEPGTDEDLEARITLRLPPSLKVRVEEAAGGVGDSVNSWVLKALAARAVRPEGPGRRVTGTVRT